MNTSTISQDHGSSPADVFEPILVVGQALLVLVLKLIRRRSN
ncbi:hypothetical protein [Luteimonas sp. MHLX1A]|nr:hypothetical protein [Luteimonas sp. MHLX1A]